MYSNKMFRYAVYPLVILLACFAIVHADHSTLRNDEFNSTPINSAGQPSTSFSTRLRESLEHELSQVGGRHFSPFVYSGGTHGAAAGLTSSAFATEAFVPERVNQIATAITYAALANDVCWTIISSDNDGITGWTRVGTTAYYYQCEGDVTPNQPTLPANSAWLMRVNIVTSAINAVLPLLPRGNPVRTENLLRVYNIVDYGATADSMSDNLQAINSATAAACSGPSSPRAIYIPPGTTGYYALSAAWVIDDCDGIHLFGMGERSQLVATGTGNVLTITNSHNYVIRDIALSGVIGSGHGIQIGTTASPSVGASHRGIIANVTCNGVDGNCIDHRAGIITTYIRPYFTVNHPLAFTVAGMGTTNNGIFFDNNASGHNNAFSIFAPVIEGMSDHGIRLSNVEGGLISGGSVEGNGNNVATNANIRAVSASRDIAIRNVYMEQNTGVQRNVIFDSCTNCSIRDSIAGTNAVSPRGDVEILTCTNCKVENVRTNHVTVTAGSDNVLDGVSVGSQSGGCITDTGIRTTLKNIINAGNANFLCRGERHMTGHTNYVRNPGFEFWEAANVLSDWTVTGGTMTRIGNGEANTNRRFGEYAVQVVPTAGQDNAYLSMPILGTNSFPLIELGTADGGSAITVTVWAYRVAGGLVPTIALVYDGGAAVDHISMTGITAAWSRFSGTFFIRSGYTSVAVRLYTNVGTIDNAMNVYFDGVSVTPGRSLAEQPELPSNISTSSFGHVFVPFSATPTFRMNAGVSQEITMTANITGITLSNPIPGVPLFLLFKQDGVGGRTVAGWPAGVLLSGGAFTPTAGAGKWARLCLIWAIANWSECGRVLDMN